MITCCDCRQIREPTRMHKSKIGRCHECDLAKKRRLWALRYQTTRGRAKWMLQNAQIRSKDRGLEFTLVLEWAIKRLSAGVCEATGIPFDFSTNGVSLEKGEWAHPLAPSIERKNPHLGYTPDNCEIICWLLNRAKANFNRDVFDEVMRAYVEKKKEEANTCHISLV